MKTKHIVATATAAITLTSTLGAQSLSADIGISSLDAVSDGIFSNLPNTYFGEYDGDSSTASYLLINNLDASSEYDDFSSGDYNMENESDDETLSYGIIAFDQSLTASGSSGKEVLSPVMGVIPLASGWSNSDISISSENGTLDGETGTMDYDPVTGSAVLTLDNTDSTINYVSNQEDRINIESPFWISNTAETEEFSKGALVAITSSTGRMAGLLSGTTYVSSPAESMYILFLEDSNDSDSDGVADITDADNYWYSGSEYSNDDRYLTSTWLGDFIFSYTPRRTGAWGDFDAADHGYVWHTEHGFLYGEPLAGSDGNRWAVFYDFNLGWIATNEDNYPFIYAYDATIDGTEYGATWLYFVEGSGSSTKRFFYAYNGDLNTGSSFGSGSEYNGWWAVAGAYSN